MITVYAEGSSVIVKFVSDYYVISIPSGYDITISDVRLGNSGVVYFKANGREDFLSVIDTILGEAPNYIPFKYSIISDLNNQGVKGLRKLIKGFAKSIGYLCEHFAKLRFSVKGNMNYPHVNLKWLLVFKNGQTCRIL